MDNNFKTLAGVDCAGKIEKKGKFSYLSWAFAVEEVGKRFPNWLYEVKRFDGVPYLKTELGYFVEVSVTIDGVERSEIMPVLDNRNQPIATPTTFEINTSTKRCLVKALAFHGLGLFIYAGEDLPSEDLREVYSEAERNVYHSLVNESDDFGLYEFWFGLPEEKQNALYNSFPDGQKVAMKKASDSLLKHAVNSVNELVEATDSAVKELHDDQIAECISDVSDHKRIKAMFFNRLLPESQEYIKLMLKAA